MKVTTIKNAPLKPNPHKLEAKLMVDIESAEVIHLTLNPGEKLIPHKTPVDVLFFILEGSPKVRIGDEYLIVEKETIIESPKNITHCFYNESDKIARILVIKTPKPTEKTIFVKD